MWAGALKSEGIPCVLVPLATGVAAFGATIWRPFQMRVRGGDAERAKVILLGLKGAKDLARSGQF